MPEALQQHQNAFRHVVQESEFDKVENQSGKISSDIERANELEEDSKESEKNLSAVQVPELNLESDLFTIKSPQPRKNTVIDLR